MKGHFAPKMCIEKEVDPEEILEYMHKNIEEGDYIEVYFGRVHVEGTVVVASDGFFRVDTDNDLLGTLEFDVSSIIDDLIELVHIKEDNAEEKIILRVKG
ncbi:DUF2097 domain-containing protein [Methanotorris igneus]|uniref:Uncharacterized protein n=1 Tax=Methanotorris igneus (strain DSM 5666 / JCM 11834 / Kol 5) TaxID=880724 RepID=F6BBU9_METIK|nr:DUF2097 domain-containing protein [Methanotorris igneus]AEF97229.1 Protein of unknown function DUF2097 [Methanotorris igneus Kol 5]